MSDTLARIVAALALLGLLINGVWLWRTSSRVSVLGERLADVRESRLTDARFLEGLAEGSPKVTRPPVRHKAKSKGKGKAKGKAKARNEELSREDIRMARLERRRSQVSAVMNSEIEAFAEEQGLDPETADEVIEEILLLREGSVLIREDMREKRLTNFEGRAELRAMREDSDARLVEILGAEPAAALRERFADERDARRPE